MSVLTITCPSQRMQEPIQKLFDKYVAKIIHFRQTNCTELVATTELNAVTSFCVLLDSIITTANGVDPDNEETFEHMLELWFLFCLIWSVGASVDSDSRKKMDNFIRECQGQFPAKVCVWAWLLLCHFLYVNDVGHRV